MGAANLIASGSLRMLCPTERTPSTLAAPMGSASVRSTQEDPEFELLLRCARSDQIGAEGPRAFRSQKRPFDWGRFLAMADRNGMAPLAFHVLDSGGGEQLPPATRELLHDYFRVNELRSRMLTGELLRVLGALESQGIRAIPIKGPLLAMYAYGHAALREFVDLDIVVRRADVAGARQVLEKLGYCRDIKAQGPHHELAHIRAWNEDEWVSADGLVYIDLHWRLSPARLPFRLEPELFWPLLETAWLEGRPVRTLSREVLLVYLCMHGSKDRWRRLIWLCDVDRTLRRHGTLDWGAVLSLATTARCQRALALGLLLARTLLKAPVPDPPPTAALEPGLARSAGRIRGLLAVGEPPASFLHAWLNVRGYHIESLDGFGDRLWYVVRTLLTPTLSDWERFRLPDALYPLYYLLRPMRLAARGGKLIWKLGMGGGVRSTSRG